MRDRRFRSLAFACALTAAACLAPLPLFGQKLPDLARIFAGKNEIKGKRPVIIIPGLLGSELINRDTGEKVWFRFGRSDDDDVKLPIALDLSLSRDRLVPGDILRELKIPILRDVKIYQHLIDALEKYGGYTAAEWKDPPDIPEDRYFVFPYDWRRDNVETARILVKKIEELKQRLGRPELKFDVLAHSMGGLIARYAAMYGDRDIDKREMVPDWSGARHFKRIFLFGTPNKGSVSAFKALLDGYATIGGINLPFVRDLTPVELITMPSLFQLMPHRGSYKAFDEDLNPIELDIYDPIVWRTHGWSVYGAKKLLNDFSEAEIGRMEEYMEIALARAQSFHRALQAGRKQSGGVDFYLIGSDCIDTLNGFIVYRDKKKKRWRTITKAKSFRNSKGRRISSDQLRRILFVPGDGRVTRESLLGESDPARGAGLPLISAIRLAGTFLVCEEHEKLTGNRFIQNNFLTALISASAN